LRGLDHVVDPSTDKIRVVNSFADLFTLARRFDACSLTLPVLTERVKSLQVTLLEVMPSKSGQDIILYNIMLYYIMQYIILYNVSDKII
jgi:hypothetical protein